MVNEVKNNLDSIIETCKQMQVKSLYLFGSASRQSDFRLESDVDFLFQFVEGHDGLPASGFDYFDLLFKLEEITGRKVDLVIDKSIRNKYLLESIMEDRIKIYEA